MTQYARQLSTDEALAVPYAYPADTGEADLTQAIEAGHAPLPPGGEGLGVRGNPSPGTLLDMTTGEILAAPAAQPLAPAALNGEWISRAARLATLEREADAARSAYVHAHYEYGEVLREYKDLCIDEATPWLEFVGRQGLTLSSANRLIKVAQAVRQLPSLRDLASRQYTRALTLIEGLDGDTLTQIADGTGPLRLEDIDAMPLSRLKKEIKQLREETEAQVKRQTKVLLAERDALVKDNARLAALTGDDLDSVRKTVERLTGEIAHLKGTLTGLYRQLDAVPLAEALSPSGQLVLNAVEAKIQGIATAGQDLWTHWFDLRSQDWGHGE